jgi:hypothetical protein
MKQVLIIILFTMGLFSCGNNSGKNSNTTDSTASSTAPAAPGASNSSAQTNADNGGAYPTDSTPGNVGAVDSNRSTTGPGNDTSTKIMNTGKGSGSGSKKDSANKSKQ